MFSLTVTDIQMARVELALRSRELGWEVKRRWDATTALPPAEQAAARASLQDKVSEWTGRKIDDAGVPGSTNGSAVGGTPSIWWKTPGTPTP